jgi:AcrR family transcriptional regulator
MSRKSIPNVDEKILEEVIRETFRYGVAMISTKKVAKHLHISEPVIFAHFKTKQNLIDQTFAYAWNKIPGGDFFPPADNPVTDPSISNRYLDQFREILSYPKELVFCDAYYHSSYFHQDFASGVMKGIVERLVPIFESYQTGRSDEQRHNMVVRYLENMVADLAQIARGIVPNNEENLRVAVGSLLFGTYGLLTQYRALK